MLITGREWLDSDGVTRAVGIDEAGRGPWAGPVVAAAVVFGGHVPDGLDDSKRLTARRRAAAFDAVCAAAAVGIGIAEAEEIDAINILRATEAAMARALAALPGSADAILIDGNHVPPGLGTPAEAVVKGDGKIAEIAAASIVAKVMRDRMMASLAAARPGYGWERNMGYGTAEHRAGLLRLGPTLHHRRTFRPIAEILSQKKT